MENAELTLILVMPTQPGLLKLDDFQIVGQ